MNQWENSIHIQISLPLFEYCTHVHEGFPIMKSCGESQ